MDAIGKDHPRVHLIVTKLDAVFDRRCAMPDCWKVGPDRA